MCVYRVYFKSSVYDEKIYNQLVMCYSIDDAIKYTIQMHKPNQSHTVEIIGVKKIKDGDFGGYCIKN